MTIVYRDEKGSPLTADEVDENFRTVVADIAAVVTDAPNGIANIFADGTQMHVVLDDATEFVLTMPQANFRPAITQTVSTTTYDLLSTDANKYKRCTNAAGCAVMVPVDLAILVDSEIYFRSVGAGPVVIDWPTDVTVNVPEGYLPETAGQHSTIFLKCVAADEYDLDGALAVDATA